MIFVELPLFQKHIAFTDEELRAVQVVLLDNPEAGDLIQGSGGLRKLRAAVGGCIHWLGSGTWLRPPEKTLDYWHEIEAKVGSMLVSPTLHRKPRRL